MKLLKKISQFSLLIVSSHIFGQFTDEINTNRPGNSAGAYSVGKKILQIETGVNYINDSHSLLKYDSKGYGIDLSTRYGLLKEQLEIALDVQFQTDQYKTKNFSETRSGLRQTTFGAKYLLYDPFNKKEEKPNIYSWRDNHRFKWRNLLPAVSAYAGVNYTMNNSYSIPNELIISPKIMLITQQHINSRWAIVTNIFADKIASINFNYGYVATITYGINQKWSALVENKGIKGDYYSDGIFTAGATYLLKSNLQIDASLSKNIKNTPDLFTAGIGVSWRYDKWHKDPESKVVKPVKEGKESRKSKRNKSKSGVLSEEELEKAAQKSEKKKRKNKDNLIDETKPKEEKKKRVDDLDTGE